LLLIPSQAQATPAEVQRRAEEAFAAGLRERDNGGSGHEHFRAAARLYEELRAGGARNARLYRNLGNAHRLAADLPRAILAYRLGLRLAPGDRALREGLADARREVEVDFAPGSALGRPPMEVRPRWLPPWGPAWAYALAAVLSLAGWACLARWLMLRNGRVLAAGLALLVLAAGASWLVLRGRERPPRPVVVLARNGVLLRRGDGEAFPPRYATPLPRGVEAELLYERDGWLQVELSGGEVGWVAATEVVVGE
jgi:hypothetical protein